jgi:hypothetical protein
MVRLREVWINVVAPRLIESGLEPAQVHGEFYRQRFCVLMSMLVADIGGHLDNYDWEAED